MDTRGKPDNSANSGGGSGGGPSNRRGKDNSLGDVWEPRKEGRSRREEKREERRRRERSNDHNHNHHHHHHHHHHHRRSSASPPLSPRVTILKHSETSFSSGNSNLHNNQPNTVTSTPLTSGPSTPVHLIHSQNHQQVTQHQPVTTLSQGGSNLNHNTEETMTDMIDGTPITMKIIDTDTWSFLEHPAADFLFGDAQSSGSGGFTVVSAVGMQSVGKSSLLNRIARANVFKTHQDPNNFDSLLKHITRGIDLHVTQERFLLLDSQPLMSASCLDEYIKNGSGVSNSIPDSSEPETNVFITSLQLLCFLLAVSDIVIIVNDWTIDINFIKLIATAMMMVGNDTNQAELIFQVPEIKSDGEKQKLFESLRSFLVSDCFNVKEIIDENEATPDLVKLLSRPTIHDDERGTSHTCEKSWLINAQRYWENSIRKSTIFSDYARLML